MLAAVFRLIGNDWDGYEHYHPDERYVAWVATSINAPETWATALDPQNSSFNPFYWPKTNDTNCVVILEDEPRSFAYGHLPLYLGVLATRAVERFAPQWFEVLPETCLEDGIRPISPEFDRITAVGRATTALFDIGTVWLIFLLGTALYDERVGWLAAAFLAVNVMHIQLAHFFAVDPYMTFFIVATILCLIRALKRHQLEATSRRINVWLTCAAICGGLAVGSKFSAVLLLFPLTLTWFWVRSDRVFQARGVRAATGSLIGLGLWSLLAFALTNPFALRDFSCEAILPAVEVGSFTIPEINLGNCYLLNIVTQSNMVGGSAEFPFTRQYFGTRPFAYFAEMQIRWGMGLPLGMLAFAALGWILWRAVRRIHPRSWIRNESLLVRPSARAEWIVLAWFIPYMLSTGNFFVKFMRYMQPLTPFMMLFAAAWVLSWQRRWLRRSVAGLVFGLTLVYALAFVNLYRQPHPWLTASHWLFDNAPNGSLILSELWGDRLPSSILVDGKQFSSRTSAFEHEALTWLSGTRTSDSAEKLDANLALLASADYLVIDSNRIYGVVPRLPTLYPQSSGVYQPLFDGSLGYEPVFVTARMPQLGNIYLKADFFSWAGLEPPVAVSNFLAERQGVLLGRADESFTLYDQSLVMVFENVGQFSAEKMHQQLTLQP